VALSPPSICYPRYRSLIQAQGAGSLRAFFYFQTEGCGIYGAILKRLTSYVPAGHLGTKRMGELAELAFMYRAATHGFGVARPYGDSHPYDILLQHGRRLLRIQVKSCFGRERTAYHTGFSITVSHHLGKTKFTYSAEDIDFIAAFVAPYDTWYLIPLDALGQTKSIRLYPASKGLKRRGGFYEQYREAWHLLKQKT
jgi:hypothetical protein